MPLNFGSIAPISFSSCKSVHFLRTDVSSHDILLQKNVLFLSAIFAPILDAHSSTSGGGIGTLDAKHQSCGGGGGGGTFVALHVLDGGVFSAKSSGKM